MAGVKARKTFEVVQYLEHYGFTVEELEARIKSLSSISRWSYIIHDKDINSDGSLKAPHFHAVLCFSVGKTFKSVADALGVPIQQVSKIQSTTSSAEAYETHLNAPEKYQYSPEAVVSSFDYVGFYNKFAEKVTSKKSFKRTLELILDETIRPYNIVNYVGIEDYTLNKVKYERAFKYMQDLKGGLNRDMQCIFIYGDTGTGKTTLAKHFASEKNQAAFVSSSGKNPLDDYGGQEVIILDDIRKDTFKLNDFLKLTDNNTPSLVGCRYYNKSIAYCKTLICTSVFSPEELFSDYGEDLGQIYRRFSGSGGIIEVLKDTLIFRAYDERIGELVEVARSLNPVSVMYSKEKAEAFVQNFAKTLNLEIKGNPTLSITDEQYKQAVENWEKAPF